MGFKQIYSLFRQDLTNAMRDNIILYMIFAPVLLAIGARLLLPSLEATKLRFAADVAIGQALIDDLDRLGDVEVLEGSAAVQERVGRSDDVPGIILDESGTGYTVLLEGNEPEGEDLANLVMATLLRDEAAATVLHEQFRETRSLLKEYTAVILAMTAVLMGGMATGFIMVDEKESKAIRALAVTPLTMGQYTMARSTFAILTSSFVAISGSAVLMGTSINYGLLLIACLIASGVGVVLGYITGGFANNQFEAMAVIKIISFFYLTVPIITIFVPAQWQFFFYWLPNYWMFKAFENLFVGQVGSVGFWGTCALTLTVSALYLAGMLPRLRSKMRLRFA